MNTCSHMLFVHLTMWLKNKGRGERITILTTISEGVGNRSTFFFSVAKVHYFLSYLFFNRTVWVLRDTFEVIWKLKFLLCTKARMFSRAYKFRHNFRNR